VQFEWDERKRRANLAKHGIDFAALGPMFAGNLVEDDDTRREYGERRIKAIGELNGIIISVVYTWRGDRRRLISARKARADERKEYQAKLAAG
jgi:uncharacterized protein